MNKMWCWRRMRRGGSRSHFRCIMIRFVREDRPETWRYTKITSHSQLGRGSMQQHSGVPYWPILRCQKNAFYLSTDGQSFLPEDGPTYWWNLPLLKSLSKRLQIKIVVQLQWCLIEVTSTKWWFFYLFHVSSRCLRNIRWESQVSFNDWEWLVSATGRHISTHQRNKVVFQGFFFLLILEWCRLWLKECSSGA